MIQPYYRECKTEYNNNKCHLHLTGVWSQNMKLASDHKTPSDSSACSNRPSHIHTYLDCADRVRVLVSFARAQESPLALPFPSQRWNHLQLPCGAASRKLRTEAGARSTSQKSWLQLSVSSAAQKPKIARFFVWNGSVCHQRTHSCSCTALNKIQ